MFFATMCHSLYSVLLATLAIVSYTGALTTTRYMTSYCNPERPIYVNDSIILELTNHILEDSVNEYIHCSAIITTEPSRKLLIHFILLAISFENQTPDSFHIYDYDKYKNWNEQTPKTGLYGMYDQYFSRASPGVGDYLSSWNKFRLKYIGKPTLTYSGFRLLITAIKDTETDGSCPRMFRKCLNKNICTPLSVWCDSDSNCGQGDRSDEESCDTIVSTKDEYKYVIVTAVVTAVIAVVLFLLTIAIVACILMRYSRRNYFRCRTLHVYAKKSAGDWKIANGMGLTLQMGPPKYDDVIGNNPEDPPPSYDAVTTPRGSTHFDTEDIDDDCTTVVIHNENGDSAIQLSACNSEGITPLEDTECSGLTDDADSSSHNMSASSSGDSCYADKISQSSDREKDQGPKDALQKAKNAPNTNLQDVHIEDNSSVESTPKRVNPLHHSVSVICDEIEYIDSVDENSSNVLG